MHSKNIELIILVYLLMTFCIPSSFGIYRKSASSNSSATTAKWDVSLNQNGINDTLSIVNDGSIAIYTLKFVSDSEVDTEYSIIISNIPNGVDVKLDTENNYRTPVNGIVTIDPAGTINYTGSSVEVTHTLTFRANAGATVVNNQTIDIDVNFKQA